MNELLVISTCGDGSCCCLPSRSTIVLIALLSLVACFTDKSSNDAAPTSCEPGSMVMEYVESMRLILITLFQMANLLLLLASIVENATLIQIYVWYTLSFVVLGFIMAIVDFLLRIKVDGIGWSLISFVSDVAFLFVIYRCLPLVDTYRKHLNGESSIKN